MKLTSVSRRYMGDNILFSDFGITKDVMCDNSNEGQVIGERLTYALDLLWLHLCSHSHNLYGDSLYQVLTLANDDLCLKRISTNSSNIFCIFFCSLSSYHDAMYHLMLQLLTLINDDLYSERISINSSNKFCIFFFSVLNSPIMMLCTI